MRIHGDPKTNPSPPIARPAPAPIVPLPKAPEIERPIADRLRLDLQAAGAPMPKRPFFEILPRVFSAELSANAGDGGVHADARLGLDLGALRDQLAPHLARDEHDLFTTLVDLGCAQLWDVGLGTIEWGVKKVIGADVQYQGLQRFMDDIGARGMGAFRTEGFEWKDGNFGTMVNTLHGVPFTLASGFFRARGHSPEVSFAAGLFTNLMHEFVFECWEQPKSLHDLVFMNTLGALFGAFPNLGMEVTWNAVTGQPASVFYGEDNHGNRYSLAFEQHKDYGHAGVPIPDRPILPYDLIFATRLELAGGLSAGVNVRLHTDPNEKNDVFRAVQNVSVGATLRYQLP